MSGKEMKNLLESLNQVNEFGPIGRAATFGRKGTTELKNPKAYEQAVDNYKGILDWNPNVDRMQLINKLALEFGFNPMELRKELDRRKLLDYMPPSRDFGESKEPKSFREILGELDKKG